MSLLTASKIVIQNLDILKKAVAGFGGLTWKEGQNNFKWYFDGPGARTAEKGFGQCEHAIGYVRKNEDSKYGYEIGVVRNKNGEGWSLVFDPHDYSLAERVGSQCEQLVAAYTDEFIRDFASKNGYMVEQGQDEEGNVQLTLIDNN
jgi:hypothetical protein